MRAFRWIFIVGICVAAVDAVGFGFATYLGYEIKPSVVDPDLGVLRPYRGDDKWFSDKDSYELRKNTPLVILGDSTVRANHIEDSKETFVGLLGGVNAGMDGYDTYRLQTLFANRIAASEPRSVGLITSIDDFITLELSHAFRQMDSSEFQRQQPTNWMAYLAKHFQPADKPDANEILDGHAVAQFQRRMRAIVEKREPLDEMTLAQWGQAVKTIQSQTSRLFFVGVLPPASHVDAMMRGKNVSALYDQIRNWCEKNQIVYIDLLPAFQVLDYTDAYVSGFNLTRYGHQLVAKVIKDSLELTVAIQEQDSKEVSL